jgi:hypothetical protein
MVLNSLTALLFNVRWLSNIYQLFSILSTLNFPRNFLLWAFLNFSSVPRAIQWPTEDAFPNWNIFPQRKKLLNVLRMLHVLLQCFMKNQTLSFQLWHLLTFFIRPTTSLEKIRKYEKIEVFCSRIQLSRSCWKVMKVSCIAFSI